MNKNEIVMVLPMAVLVLGMVSVLWYAFQQTRLNALLRERHPEIWGALGSPGTDAFPEGEERRRLFKAAKEFVRNNRQQPLNDPQVNRLCRNLRIWHAAWLPAFVILGIGSVIIGLALARA